MIGQIRFAKNQTGAETIWIAGIDSAQRRNQKIIRRAAAKDPASPIVNRFKLSRAQSRRVDCESTCQRNQLRDRQRQLLRLTAIDESLARFASHREERYADVCANRFQSRRTQQPVRCSLNQSMLCANRFDQSARAISFLDDANVEAMFGEEVSGGQT